jgi:hypothetical protein
MRKRGSEDGSTATTDGATDLSRHIGSMPPADICVLPVSAPATESAVRCPARPRPERNGTRDRRNLDTGREAANELIAALRFDTAEAGSPSQA